MESFQQAIRKPVLYRPANFNDLWQHNPMITAGTHPSISIDFGKDEPGMTPDRELLFLAGIIEKTFLRVQCHEEQMHTIVA